MLALRLLIILLIEILIYSTIATLIYQPLTLSCWLWTVFIGFICFRTFLIILFFTVAWFFRQSRAPDQQINSLKTLRLIVCELSIFFALYTYFQLFEAWLHLRNSRRKPEILQKYPVLLIHGFMCNSGYWWAMIRALGQRGLGDLFTLNLEPVFGKGADIDRFAEQVKQRVEYICQVTSADKVILVGHSMGGLVALTYLKKREGTQRVAKIITLGSPHQGSIHAHLLPGLTKQMRPGNAWLQQLRTIPHPIEIPVISIYSHHDDLVAPQDTSVLEYATNIGLPGIGHLEMSFSKRIQTLVGDEIINCQ